MQERNYWGRMRRKRVSRRTLLGASARAGVGAAGLALVGCGDDDDDQQQAAAQVQQAQQQQQAMADQQQEAQQQQAVAAASAWPAPGEGGAGVAPYVGLSSGDPPTLDPYENLTYRTQIGSAYHYAKLIREVEGAPGIAPINTAEISSDASDLPEIVDPITYLFRIRDDIYWHDVDPTNGRQLTVDDIMHTYSRFREVSPNSAGWDLVVDQFTPGEDNTITAKLHKPHAPFLTLASSSQHLWFIPPEIVDDGTVAERPVGAGPWIFEEFEPGVALRWRRNPNWHIKYGDSALPLQSNLTKTMQNDPNVLINAIAGGNLDMSLLSATVFKQMDDAIPAEYDRSRFFVFTPNTVPGGFYFNFSIPPWNDVRMRLALSRALDRDAVLTGVDDTGQGGWHSGISQLPPFWMDPRDLDTFGETYEGEPSGINFHVDRAEAQKLLSAAGYPEGIQAKIHNTQDYGAATNNFYAANIASVAESGFQFESFSKEYAAYIASIFKGNFPDNWDGESSHLAIGPLYGGATDPEDLFAACYARTSGRHNWGSAGRVAENSVSALDTGGNAEGWFHPNAATDGGPETDETLHDMFAKQKEILDLEERIEYINNIQRYMATKMYIVPYPATPGVYAFNPWVKQMDFENVHPKTTYGWGGAFEPHVWIDQDLKNELT